MRKSEVRIVPLKLAGAATSVKTKRVRQSDGKTVSLHWIDTESPKFDAELSAIFAKNVAKARRENSLSPEIRKLSRLPGVDKVEARLVGGAPVTKRGKRDKP